MKNILMIEHCCGCGGCSQKCPKKCIEIEQDVNGFWKASCDELNCIECGICLNVCPMMNATDNEISPPNGFAAVTKNKEFYNRSSSGGMFSEIAELILSKDGVVWGCGFDCNLVPRHMSVTKISDLDKLRRSKYVQSYLGDSFTTVKQQLDDGQEVMFVGTPCQVSGLKKFLGKKYDNLMLIDLVCHGVPSPGMFKENLRYLEKKKKKKIVNYEFRLKGKVANKYSSYTCTYTYACGEQEIKPYYMDAYFNEFYDMTLLNECCYSCPYANSNRQGDLTIGDFEWGKKWHQEFDLYSELSCILVNTLKGEAMFNEIRKKLLAVPTKWDYIIEKNLNLLRPTLKPRYRNLIYNEILEKGYEQWADDYYHSLRYLKKTPFMRPFVKIKIIFNKIKSKI